jgi:hypothetical protein
MRFYRQALNLALALCAVPALVLSKPDASEAAARAATPVLPLRPIAQHGLAFGDNYIVGGELADAADSKWAVALVTNSRVRGGLTCLSVCLSDPFGPCGASCAVVVCATVNAQPPDPSQGRPHTHTHSPLPLPTPPHHRNRAASSSSAAAR